MFNVLDAALKGILESADAPVLVRDADISFDRPSDTFNHDTTKIGLFLYDIRENTELRSSEPFIERANGVATIKKPPIRLACSYLVTTWAGTVLTGEEAILKQHELLGAVLKVFSSIPTIPASLMMQGELATQPYPIPLATLQGDLTRSPAEFWSALGGKLRPSFTLTATIALMSSEAPVSAHLVSTSKLVVASKKPDIPEKDGKLEEVVFQIGGRATESGSGKLISGVAIALPALSRSTETDAQGQFSFSGIPAGTYELRFTKAGYEIETLSVQVPGGTPTAFDIELTVVPPPGPPSPPPP
jgi:hypothetical protein